MSTTMTNILPDDMVMDILSRLPVKSLLRFRCVSKHWKIFFSDPSFIKMHLNHSINNNYEHLMLEGSSSLYSIAANNSNESSLADKAVVIDDYPFKTKKFEVKILGSCNGLFLITLGENNYSIWNPSTKEFKKLPKAPPITDISGYDEIDEIVYGFGYDEITEDYKVVIRITTTSFKSEGSGGNKNYSFYSEVKVYSLRSNLWRKIQTQIPGNLTGEKPRIFVNGALHYWDWEAENDYIIIVSFNLGDEKCRVIEQPNYQEQSEYLFLNVLGGCLCITRHFQQTRSEIWVMKDYGVKESWTKIFNFSQRAEMYFDYMRPIKFTKNGEVVFEKDNDSLVVYDPKHGTAKPFKIRGLKAWRETYAYVESLISLNSGTFVGQEHPTLEETLALEEHATLEETLSNRIKNALENLMFWLCMKLSACS